MTMRPSSSWMRRSVSITTCAFIGSSEAMGSSARMILGSCISARAIATRCCWPPDKASARFGRLFGNAQPVQNIQRAAGCRPRGHRLNMVGRVERRFRMPCSTFEATSMPRHQIELLKDHRALALPCARLLPLAGPAHCGRQTEFRPMLASVSRFIIRRKVDFPAPERPMMPTKAGRSMAKLMRSTAAFWPNILVTALTCSMAIVPHRLLRGWYRRCVTLPQQFREACVTPGCLRIWPDAPSGPACDGPAGTVRPATVRPAPGRGDATLWQWAIHPGWDNEPRPADPLPLARSPGPPPRTQRGTADCGGRLWHIRRAAPRLAP